MTPSLLHFRAHPYLLIAAALGLAVAVLLPAPLSLVTRALGGWNVAVWSYLALVLNLMLRADHARLRRLAEAQAEGALTVLVVVIVAAVVSLIGVVAELSAVKQQGLAHGAAHVLFALATVVGAWILVPTLFALTYASRYYADRDRDGHGDGGLEYPGSATGFTPDYADFMYFSFTIAVASQTADVSVSTRAMRRLVLLQAVLSFAFNTAILAFTINLAASLF